MPLKCASAVAQDVRVPACESWCDSALSSTHCATCKCALCSFCLLPAPPSPPVGSSLPWNNSIFMAPPPPPVCHSGLAQDASEHRCESWCSHSAHCKYWYVCDQVLAALVSFYPLHPRHALVIHDVHFMGSLSCVLFTANVKAAWCAKSQRVDLR